MDGRMDGLILFQKTKRPPPSLPLSLSLSFSFSFTGLIVPKQGESYVTLYIDKDSNRKKRDTRVHSHTITRYLTRFATTATDAAANMIVGVRALSLKIYVTFPLASAFADFLFHPSLALRLALPQSSSSLRHNNNNNNNNNNRPHHLCATSWPGRLRDPRPQILEPRVNRMES